MQMQRKAGCGLLRSNERREGRFADLRVEAATWGTLRSATLTVDLGLMGHTLTGLALPVDQSTS